MKISKLFMLMVLKNKTLDCELFFTFTLKPFKTFLIISTRGRGLLTPPVWGCPIVHL